MVTVQNIGVQLTRPIKELAEWNFPFSQTLEKYCSLFNTDVQNQSFGEAGLVLQNSTAVYAHRVDSLWHKIEYFRNIFADFEKHEEETQGLSKKKERKANTCFQEFNINDFSQEMEKSIDMRAIDIKRNHVIHNTIKSKCYRFTQLEKSSMQNVSIDIYDVNGEVIGKKYDFRCNQNITMDGILIDEFAPQDFCCTDDDIANLDEFSLIRSISHGAESLESSMNMLSGTAIRNESNNGSTRINDQSEEKTNQTNNDGSLEKEVTASTDLNASFSSDLQNSSSSGNSDRTLVETSTNTPNNSQSTVDNSQSTVQVDSSQITLTGSLNETSLTSCDASSPIKNTDATANNDDSDAKRHSNDLGSPLNSQSVDSKEIRTSSMDESAEKMIGTNAVVQTTSRNDNTKTKRARPVVKSPKKKLTKKELASRKKRATKMIMRLSEEPYVSQRKELNMLEKSLNTCVKNMQKHHRQQYESITSETMDLLGFRLSNNNNNNNVTIDVRTISNGDEMSAACDANPARTSLSRENPSSEIWLPSTDSPYLASESVEKWHESMRPKLREAEQRSAFCIRDYASRIMNVLKTNVQQKINFDSVMEKEGSYEVARYFLASLDLASKQNVDIIKDDNLEHNIEIVLREESGECSADDQTTDSHD